LSASRIIASSECLSRQERHNRGLDDLLRQTDARIHAAVALAELAGADDRTSAAAVDRALRAAHALQIASVVLRAPARNDFPTLCGVGDAKLSASIVSLWSAWAPPSLLADLAALAPAAGAAALSDLERARRTAAVLAFVAAHGIPVLRRSDFTGGGGVPHVGIIYVVCVTMTAQCWLDEYERVIERNERISRATGEELEAGNIIMVAEMAPLARALVESDKSGARCALPLTGFYIGKELRAEKSGGRFGRAGEHGSRSGNANIREVYYVRASAGGARGAASILVEPLCNCPSGERVTVVRCSLALLPPRERLVDLAEDTIMCFFTALGLPLFNNTPGTARRWLNPSYRGERPLLEETLELLLGEVGVDALAKRTATEGVTYFVARALRAIELRLHHGQHVNLVANSEAPPLRTQPLLQIPPSAAAPAGRAFSQLQCIEAALGSRLRRVVRMRLWSGGCTCEGGYCSGPICNYQLLVRMYVAARPSLAATRLPDRDYELLHMGLTRGSSSRAASRFGATLRPGLARLEDSAGGARASAASAAAAAASALPLAAVGANLSVDLLALGVVLPHLSSDTMGKLHSALRTAMASTRVWEQFQERSAAGGGANFSGAHMPLARLTTAVQVAGSVTKRRKLLDTEDPLARLETALRATSALPAFEGAAPWGAAVVQCGGGAAASAASALYARAYPPAAPALALAPSLAAAAAAAPADGALAAMMNDGGDAAAHDVPRACGFEVGGGGGGDAAAPDPPRPPPPAAVGSKRVRAAVSSSTNI